jgi:hypothetical protein
MIENMPISEHFTLYELTCTDRIEFLEENRKVDSDHIVKLKSVAVLLELCRLCLDTPIIVHSGYRCKPLNDAVGSTDRSQHLLCEAVDFTVKGLDCEIVFRKLRAYAHEGKLPFGQMIWEKAERSYGTTEWIHLSLGFPYRNRQRCGQILTMSDGEYNLIETIKEALT